MTARKVVPVLAEECGHMAWIGSYPGNRLLSCVKPRGHDDPHEAVVEWNGDECENCSTVRLDQ